MATIPASSLFADVSCAADLDDRSSSTAREQIAGRTGIARLAALSPLMDAKRGAEYFLLPARSIVNRCDSERMPFPWTINPYRGCEFGCQYCYARYTHEYMELDGADFERKIFVKENTGELAARELRKLAATGEHIAIGTATDPYQPAEAEFGATRAILEEMALLDGLSVSITTKSNRVLQDIDVLQKIAARSELSINITITTARPRLARLLEPRAPRPDLRFAAVRALREASLDAGVFVMPVLPGITDGKEDLETLARLASELGAQWLAASVLFLMPSSRRQFLPFLAQKFPRLVQRYQQWYERNGYAPEAYRREIGARIAGLRSKHGLAARPIPQAPRGIPCSQQLTFALGPETT